MKSRIRRITPETNHTYQKSTISVDYHRIHQSQTESELWVFRGKIRIINGIWYIVSKIYSRICPRLTLAATSSPALKDMTIVNLYER